MLSVGQRRVAASSTALPVAASPVSVGEKRKQPIWPLGIILAVVYAPFLVSRLASFNALWFVHIGRQMLVASSSSTVITPGVGWQSRLGYDGQYYWALAVDPAHAKDYMASNGGFVYSRPLYPALARVLALGSHNAVPYAMLAINLVAVIVGTLAVAAWLRRRSVAPSLALLYGLFPGMVFSAFRDLTEPLAFALVTLAALAFDARSRRGTATTAILLALAGLTRETSLLFAVPAALTLGSGAWEEKRVSTFRSWRRGIVFLVAAVGPLLAWREVVSTYVGEATQERGSGLRWFIPFDGIAHYLPWDGQHKLIVMTVVLPTIMALLGASVLFWRRRARALALLLVLNAAAFVVFLPSDVDIDYGAAGRAAIGVMLAVIACLPAWQREERLSRPGALLAGFWSLPWYVLVSAGLGVPGIALITS